MAKTVPNLKQRELPQAVLRKPSRSLTIVLLLALLISMIPSPQVSTEIAMEWLSVPWVPVVLGALVLVALFIAVGHNEDD